MSYEHRHPKAGLAAVKAVNTQVVLVKRAKGIPQADNFRLIETPLPECPKGGILIRNLALAVDAGMRGWVSEEPNYLRVEVGSVMRAYAVGEVLESDHPDYRPGEKLFGLFHWQTFCAAMPRAVLWKVDTAIAPVPVWLSIFALNGLAAYIGLTDFVEYQPGESIVVSTAAGGVGALVGQLARHGGMKTIGLTSSDVKVQLCLTEFGYERALNYRDPGFAAALAAACPQGIDVFFDNTGGGVSDVVFERLNRNARIVQCGTAAISSWLEKPPGPRRERDMLIKELTWRGFILLNHMQRVPAALEQLKILYRDGILKAREHVLEGLQYAPGAIAMLYNGENQGRLIVSLST